MALNRGRRSAIILCMRRRPSTFALVATSGALAACSAFSACPALAQDELPPPPPPSSAPATTASPSAATPEIGADASASASASGSGGGASVPGDSPVENFLFNRRHTLAEAEIGVLALPSAPISNGSKGGDTPLFGKVGQGDATLQIGLHLLLRGGRNWAIGAGALLTPLPTTDTLPALTSGLVQTHSRSYLFLGGEARFIPLHIRTFEGWAGVTVGGIVVADRYTTKAGDAVPPILGSKETTVHAIGLVGGLQAGIDWLFTDQLLAGVVLRFDHWILPSEPKCTSIFQCTTLKGPVTAVELGLKIGYSIPL
jgi:hypothetical protein